MASQDSGYAAIEGERPTLVLPGLYDVAFRGYSTFMMFGRAPKLNLQFKIVTYGEHFEKPVSQYCNVKKLIGHAGINGRFKVGFSCEFLRQYVVLFGTPVRLDRIPMSHFEKHIFVAKVRTVERGSTQKAIPTGLQYSTISELVRIKQ